MRVLLIVFSFVICSAVCGQPFLKPSIGLGSLPSDTDPICNIPWFLGGNFEQTGIQPGDTAADFTLYDLNGNVFNLNNALSSGKPVLLVNGNYTCPVFRNKIQVINDLFNIYNSQIEVCVIYTLEAHPDVDTSIYFGYVSVTQQNINAGILYEQPTAYGERKMIVSDMLSNTALQVPVYIDGPCNEWWTHYGPAPNNAYLIDTSGIVFEKHGWFDKFPNDIVCDIDSLLGVPSCGGNVSNGQFVLEVLSNDTVQSLTGSTLTFSANLINNSSSDVIIEVQKLVNDTPVGWGSSLCADVCYSTETDSISLLIAPGDTQKFHFYFFTDQDVDTGRARVGFRNINDNTNAYLTWFTGITKDNLSGIHELEDFSKMKVFPNPSLNQITVSISEIGQDELKIVSSSGHVQKVIRNLSYSNQIDVSDWPGGVYFIMYGEQTRKIVIN
ncbi:MAG: T9SS type A sorting domain-containing protein [Flavobacteriales bacterium]|nr:T9SS type A sorting domain-containing protein [Flavobacteriales bacterium]